MGDLTIMLARAREGDPTAEGEVFKAVYAQLRALAQAKARGLRPGDTLQPTALVNEAYLRSLGDVASFESRAHFFFVAARAMQDIVIESARRKAALKHGGGQARMALDDVNVVVQVPGEDIFALTEALERLKSRHPRSHDVVMLRYFAGLTTEEVAHVLEVGERTAHRDWLFAKAYIHSALTRSDDVEG